MGRLPCKQRLLQPLHPLPTCATALLPHNHACESSVVAPAPPAAPIPQWHTCHGEIPRACLLSNALRCMSDGRPPLCIRALLQPPALPAAACCLTPYPTPPLSLQSTPLKVALDWTPNTNHAGFYVSKAQGLYAAAGLDVSFISPHADGYGATPASRVESGEAMFAVTPSGELETPSTYSRNYRPHHCCLRHPPGRCLVRRERDQRQHLARGRPPGAAPQAAGGRSPAAARHQRHCDAAELRHRPTSQGGGGGLAVRDGGRRQGVGTIASRPSPCRNLYRRPCLPPALRSWRASGTPATERGTRAASCRR